MPFLDMLLLPLPLLPVATIAAAICESSSTSAGRDGEAGYNISVTRMILEASLTRLSHVVKMDS